LREVARAFSAQAEGYDDFYSSRADRADSIRIFGRARRNAVPGLFLDLGCGPGTAVLYDVTDKGSYVGVDISKEMVRVARKRYPGWMFELRSEADLPDEFAATIMGAFAPLQHVLNLPEFAWQIHRILQPGGRFLVMGEPTGRPVKVLGPTVVTTPLRAAQACSAFRWADDLRVTGHRRFTPGWLPPIVQALMLSAEAPFVNPDRCDWIVVEVRKPVGGH